MVPAEDDVCVDERDHPQPKGVSAKSTETGDQWTGDNETEDCAVQSTIPERNATAVSTGDVCGVTKLKLGTKGKSLVVL